MKKINKKELHNIFQGMEINKELYFNMLYEKYKKLVYAIVFSVLKNKENSEDVVQKVYMKIWQMENQKFPKSNEGSWLYALTKNEALDFIKYKKMLLNIDELYFLSEENEDISKIIDRDSYNNIVSKLNAQEQEIISLKILSNLSFKEISIILNMPEGTIKWKYYKSIHTLKLLLGNLGMFIITFVIGLKTMFYHQKEISKMTNENPKNESNTNTYIEENTTKSEESNEFRDENLNSVTQEETHQTIIQEPTHTNNYYEIGILSLSVIFLFFTIIFFIIFVKHQLKKKNKSSK